MRRWKYRNTSLILVYSGALALCCYICSHPDHRRRHKVVPKNVFPFNDDDQRCAPGFKAVLIVGNLFFYSIFFVVQISTDNLTFKLRNHGFRVAKHFFSIFFFFIVFQYNRFESQEPRTCRRKKVNKV